MAPVVVAAVVDNNPARVSSHTDATVVGSLLVRTWWVRLHGRHRDRLVAQDWRLKAQAEMVDGGRHRNAMTWMTSTLDERVVSDIRMRRIERLQLESSVVGRRLQLKGNCSN